MLYETTKGFISQDDQQSVYTLSLHGKTYSMHFCEFITLYRKLSRIDLEACLMTTDSSVDYTDLVFYRSHTRLRASLSDLIALKDLFEGAMFSLRLRDVLYRNMASGTVEHTGSEVFAF